MSLTQLAIEERNILSSRQSTGEPRVLYVPVIITTARLHICVFDPADIDMETGTLPEDQKTEEVELIRFQKSLGADFHSSVDKLRGLADANAQNERTIFVIRATRFVSFLDEFEYGQ